jgi:formylglycine-generating enzyme required for sulfatase activity
MSDPETTHTNSIGMEFILIPAGSFMMGSEKKCDNDERPLHRVTISKPFYLGKYAVTQEQWEAVMGNNPSKFKGRNYPVEMVSWDGTQEFIQRLNQQEGHKRYRLPTEAEWEYAARAGTTTKYSFGDDVWQLGQYAWYKGNSDDATHPVGQKKPNPWGLYDIHGNLWEWVQDWYGAYPRTAVTDPRGPARARGCIRVLRGGSWYDAAFYCRSACRYFEVPDLQHHVSSFFGVRLALDPE